MKLGMFDPPEMVPYTKIDQNELNSPQNRELARRAGQESMVLLKNDGTLPLKTSGIKVAIIGPLAKQTKVLLGNYNGTPTHTVSILEGMQKEFAGEPMIAEGRYSISIGGGQPNTGLPCVAGWFEVAGSQVLPE